MFIPLLPLILLAAALTVGAWFVWRYLRLKRQIRDYARALQRDPGLLGQGELADLDELVSAMRTISSRADSERAELVNERDRLAAVLDQMTDGVLIADGEGLVRLANPAARRFFDMPDPVGRSVAEVLRSHQLIEAWRQSSQRGQMQSESVEIPVKRQWLQLIAIPDRHEAGSLLLVQDLTRVRRLETIRRDFVSNISHELRTPLASLKALTETLHDGAISDPEAGPRFLELMVKEVDALTQMAQELLDLSRIESGQIVLDLSTISPHELLASASDRMKMQAERSGVALRVDCPEGLAGIRGDASRLEQVLVNLIHNAVKFTAPGGEVVLSADEFEAPSSGQSDGLKDTGIRFAVRDTGVGIPADQVPRVFERFYRVDKARSGGGTGLGLSIARHIVEAHGGKIWVESVEGRGATFYFLIPRAT